MEIKFDKKYLRELYETGVTADKNHHFQPDIVTMYQARIRTLERASKAGRESIRVNDQYRIEFKTTQVISETVVTEVLF